LSNEDKFPIGTTVYLLANPELQGHIGRWSTSEDRPIARVDFFYPYDGDYEWCYPDEIGPYIVPHHEGLGDD
jgi:hypothetical protein